MSESDPSDLSRLDDGRLAELFQQRRSDLRFLDALNDELKQRNSDDANALHIEVIRIRRALRPSEAKSVVTMSHFQAEPVSNWLNAFLVKRNMTRPDGRALYRYRMAHDEFELAKKIILYLSKSGRLVEPDVNAGALFVAYCAEWFRRESGSTFLRWEDPEPELFRAAPRPKERDLTKLGLEYWRRPLRRSEHAHEYLLTVALEGGFPVRILADGARGWLKDYLRAIMRQAIVARVDTADEILTIAKEMQGRMRKSYRHDDFVALCSELVVSLLELRKKAEAESRNGIRNSALLEAKHPGWRDGLPIYVPPEDEALIAELLNGLLDEKMTGLATEGVEVRRYLVKRNGEWHPSLQLLADGEIPSDKLPGLPPTSRARAIATGEFGKHLAGEVALFEPPAGEQRRWRVRSMRRASRLIDFPFTAPVTTTLSSPDSAPYSWTWPRGNPLRSYVLVFEPDEGSTPHEPLLRFLRTGSVSSPAKTLYVLVSRDWIAEPASDGAAAEIEDVPVLGRKLVRLTAAAYFHNGEPDAVRFRVEPDSDDREQELELGSFPSAGFALADDRWELATSPAKPVIHEAKKSRRPGIGELFARRPGGKWMQLSGPLIGTGLMELSWRDPIAHIQIEKRQLALVPCDASITGAMKSALEGEIRLQGLPGWTAAVNTTACKVDATNASALSIRFTERPVYRLPLTLRPPEGPSFDVIVPLIGRDAVIALADGAILPPGRQIDIGALRGAVAVSPRRAAFYLGAKISKTGIKTVVDGELPLGILRGVIDEMFATLPNQDDLVEISFMGDSRPSIRISRYRHQQLALAEAMVRWRPPSTDHGAAPVARMILDPRHEYALELWEGEMWRLPERCKGPCLVYVRDGVDVITRPIPIVQPGVPEAYAGDLVSALATTDNEQRQRAVLDVLARIGRGEDRTADLDWLNVAVTSLNGLPASAFDALKLLPSRPEALICMLIGARDGERSIIWSLQNELPFLWLALPLPAWLSAMESQSTFSTNKLEGMFGREKAEEMTMEWLRSVCSDLIALEPALESIFSMPELPMGPTADRPSLQDLTSSYIKNQHRRGEDARNDDAPNDIANRLASIGLKLPPEIATKSHTDFAGLFAPVLLAASSRKKLVLNREQALIARRTLREDPIYVSGAWPHLLKFYS